MFRLYFGVARGGKHRKTRCFVFSGSRKHCKLRCFDRLSKQKFSHLKGKKHRKIQHFCIFAILMVIFVFRHSPKTPFSLLPKHRKYRCFGSILGLQEKENIVNSFNGNRKHCKLRCFRHFSKREFSHPTVRTGKKHRKIQCFLFFHYPYIQIFVFSLTAKTS